MRVEDRAGTAPDVIGGEGEHQASGGGIAGNRGHGELACSGQDRLDEVIDGVDVPPGLCRRVVSCLDHIQMDAVGEEVPAAAKHDDPCRASLGMPVGGEQAAALAGAHSAAREGEFQVADGVVLAVADLLVGAPTWRRSQRCRNVRYASQ